MSNLRAFLIRPGKSVEELDQVPDAVPAETFLWLACLREDFQQDLATLQEHLERLAGRRLLDLHISDLLNAQLPSHFDFTSHYDVLVFRRLAERDASAPAGGAGNERSAPPPKSVGQGSAMLPGGKKIQTVPVGFVVFDNLLLTVHPERCGILETYIKRLMLLGHASPERSADGPLAVPVGAPRLPDSPAEQTLRIVSLMVDGYLDLRKIMTRQLDHWQQRLMRPDVRFDNWEGLLKARQYLHHLYDICEDQRNALSQWMEVLEDLPAPKTDAARHEHDQLLVRCRDVLEHIARVSSHIRQLEQSAETAIQIHFNIQSNRTNDVMRTLTAITAVFLPLNLIAGIFGMNFQFIPGVHEAHGFWWAMLVMLLIAVGLLAYFARKQYLSSNESE